MPAPGFETYGEPVSYPAKSTNVDSNNIPHEVKPVKLQRLGYQGSDINLENLSWRVINGPFVSVWMHNVPWGSEQLMAAPAAQVGGCI